MKKFRKLISIFAALCMMATLFSGMTAFAEDAVEETPAALTYYWDADHDFVSVDFEEAITEESLAGVELYLNGAKVPATVAFSLHASAGTEAALDTTRATRYTYLVTPNNGAKIAFDTVYTLKLTNVTGATSGKTVSAVVPFKVTKLSDTMNIGTTHSDWQLLKDDGSATYVTDTNGNIAITQAATGWLNLKHTLGNDKTLRDYTVKLTYSVGDDSQYYIRLASLVTNDGYTQDRGGFKGVFFHFQNAVNADKVNVDQTKYAYLYEHQYIGGTQYSNSTSTNYTIKWADVKMAEDITLKLSSKDDFARAYVNSMKAADMQLWTTEIDEKENAGGIISAVRSVNATSTDVKSVTMKDFLVTQAVEIDVIDTVPTWDADTDFVTLNFDREVDLTSLQNAVTLKKNGEAIPATVALNRHSGTDAANTSYATDISTKYTYTVTPAGGLTAGEIYTLSLNGGVLTKDGTAVFTSELNKTFKVVLLDSGMEYSTSSKENNKWAYTSSGNNSNILSMANNEDGDLVATVSTVGLKNGRYVRNYPSWETYDATLNDYTVTLKVNTEGEVTGEYYSFYTLMNNGAASNGVNFTIWTRNDNTDSIYIQQAGTNVSGVKDSRVTNVYTDIAPGGEKTIKISTKDGVINVYVNGVKVADAQVSAELGGKAGFSISTYGASGGQSTVTLSDYAMTQVVEVTDFAIGNISITGANGEAIESLSGNVNVTVPVLNGSNADKDVYVVVAFYNGTKMTNCVASPVATRSIASGDFVSIPLANISPSGGNKLKVFVWDNTTSLIPYIQNVEFPAPLGE